MPLFACSTCGSVENTALGEYWMRSNGKGYHEANAPPPRCSECASGKWHGKFPKQSAVGWSVDQSGHLWSPKEVEAGSAPSHFKIVGTVPAQGIVTEGQDPQGLGEAEGRVEPGPKDAPRPKVDTPNQSMGTEGGRG